MPTVHDGVEASKTVTVTLTVAMHCSPSSLSSTVDVATHRSFHNEATAPTESDQDYTPNPLTVIL